MVKLAALLMLLCLQIATQPSFIKASIIIKGGGKFGGFGLGSGKFGGFDSGKFGGFGFGSGKFGGFDGGKFGGFGLGGGSFH